MIALYNGESHQVKVKVYKLQTTNLEDFSRSDIRVLLVGDTDRIPMEYTVAEDVITFSTPIGLTPETYDVEVLWVKYHTLHRYHLNHSNYNQAIVRNAFTVTEYADEATNISTGQYVEINAHSSSFGYDGLNAYELAVLHGETATEVEWLGAYEGKMKLLQEAEDRVEKLEEDLGDIVITDTDTDVEGATTTVPVDPNAVRFIPQTLDTEEKWQARENIQAADAKQVTIAEALELEAVAVDPDVVTEAVRWTEQELSGTEQTQARTNIAAASEFELCNTNTVLGSKGRIVVLEEKMALIEAETNSVVGDMTTLKTTNKEFVVNSINEVYDRTGLGTTLNTTAQATNDAVNEVLDKVPEVLTEDDDINMLTDVFN